MAVVTGASRGIGEAIAKRFAAEGAHVVCVARTVTEGSHPAPGSLESTVSAIREAGGEAAAVAADLVDPAECRRAVDEARRVYGPIDVLVNNAAAAVLLPLRKFPYSRWLHSFQIMVHAPYVLSQAVLEDMVPRRSGAIVNISSGAAVGPGRAPFSSTDHSRFHRLRRRQGSPGAVHPGTCGGGQERQHSRDGPLPLPDGPHRGIRLP